MSLVVNVKGVFLFKIRFFETSSLIAYILPNFGPKMLEEVFYLVSYDANIFILAM